MSIKELLAVARGEKEADLVLRGVRVANVFTLEYELLDVAVMGEYIAGVGERYEGKEVEDLSGCVLAPGFIDGHCHIESTMLTPAGFSEVAVPRGTTTVVADPHEIANTWGMKGVEFMWKESLHCPLDIFLSAPSCVPASTFETPLENLDADAIHTMFAQGWCHSLGEVMNYPGVIEGDPELWAKLYVAGNRPRSGHAPGLQGKRLCAYLLSGCDSDHESITPSEGLEKLRRGMWLMIREGASEKNLKDLLCLIREKEHLFNRCMMVSDDLSASYLRDQGHLDEKIRLATQWGISPLTALRMVTLSPAEYFGWKDRGAIAPGRLADMVALDSLEECSVQKVWKKGKAVGKEWLPLSVEVPRSTPPQEMRHSSLLKLPEEEAFRIPCPEGAKIRVIGLIPGQVVTKHLLMEPTLREGVLVADPQKDLAMLGVVEKNRGTGRLQVGFVHGLGLQKGALFSSVAHDAHNFIVAAMDIPSMLHALEFLMAYGGGVGAVEGNQTLASLVLPVGGLMSADTPDRVIRDLQEAEKAATFLGCPLEHPFISMSFLSLSVIPELRLTDKGYVDLERGGAQSLFAYPTSAT